MIFFLISLAISIILETSITTLPLTLLLILFLAISRKSNDVFVFAFISGLMLDILSFNLIGISSLFFVSIVFIIFQYQKKFEIETINFLIAISFLGTFFYSILDGFFAAFLESIVATIIISVSYIAFRRFNKKIPKYA